MWLSSLRLNQNLPAYNTKSQVSSVYASLNARQVGRLAARAHRHKKIGDAAWEDCVALCPVAVLTTATENREQEVMLSSPVSLAPLTLEQSRCQMPEGTCSGYKPQ